MEHPVLENDNVLLSQPQLEIELPITSDYDKVFADLLSQAITGELIGMSNFASLVGLHDDLSEKFEALDHAQSERAHADAFLGAAKRMGVNVIVDLKAPYWDRIRQAFLRRVEMRDMIGTTIIQEVMLECFAISLYKHVARAAKPDLASLFNAVAQEEESHLEHAIELLRDERAKDPLAFEAKVGELHMEVVTTLAEMLSKKDSVAHCGLCHGSCVKASLSLVGLDITELRGRSINFYLTTLDRLGIRGEVSLGWIAQLPA